MFGRRRHAAQVVAAAPTPQLAEEQIFELVHAHVAAAIGESGEWVVTRRTEADTDLLFHGVLAHSIATDVTAALREARRRIESPEAATTASEADRTIAVQRHVVTAPQIERPTIQPVAVDRSAVRHPAADSPVLVAEVDEALPEHRAEDDDALDGDASLDAAALTWHPAPITVWADLKKPVTGEFPAVNGEHLAVSGERRIVA